MKPNEYDILNIFLEKMDEKGESRKMVSLSIDDTMLELMNTKYNKQLSLDELKKLADRCFANEWLEHFVLGAGKYGELILTTTGFGVARSLQKKKEALKNRTLLKKTSDYIEDHKGLFVFLGSIIALVGLLIKIFSGVNT
ncbi:hypothetical protein [Desulfotignum phosphitoxidans]|jgi:hypothetical protein|nr:hypothetical protein [Desulfotignum phosphitoxidans]